MSFDNHFFISAGSRLRSRSEIELNIFYRDLFLKHEENLKGFETIVLDARNIGVRQDFLFSLAGSIILETDAASVFFEPYSEETYEKLSDQEFVVVTKAKDEDVYFFFSNGDAPSIETYDNSFIGWNNAGISSDIIDIPLGAFEFVNADSEESKVNVCVLWPKTGRKKYYDSLVAKNCVSIQESCLFSSIKRAQTIRPILASKVLFDSEPIERAGVCKFPLDFFE